MRLQPLLLLLLCLSLPGWLQAEDIEAEKIAAIRELMDITGAHADQEQLVRTFSQQMISVIQASQVQLTPQAVEAINDEVRKVVAEQLEKELLQQKMYRIYANYFTLEELQGLIEFNRSPIGTKANRVMPLLLRESMSAAQQWSEEIGPDLSARVQQRLRQEGINIGR